MDGDLHSHNTLSLETYLLKRIGKSQGEDHLRRFGGQYPGEELLLKTDLHASELKHNTKTELGKMKINSLTALLGRGAPSRLWPSKLQAHPEEGGGGVYREIQDLAGFDRNCGHAANLLCRVFRVVQVPETKG